MRDHNADRKTGQFVVRRHEQAKIYTYKPEKKNPKKEASKRPASAIDIAVWIGHVIILLLCSLATAFLMFHAYPKTSNYLLGWVALAPFIFAIRKTRSFWGASFYSLFTGLLVYCPLFYWIYYTVQAGGGDNNMAAGATFGMGLLLALQFTCFGVCAFILKKLHITFAFFAATAWVAFEYLHLFISYKFFGAGGLLLLAYTQSFAPHMIQIASVTGAFGVSFALAFLGAEIGTVFSTKNFTSRAVSLCAAAAVFAGIFFYGKQELAANKVMTAETAVKAAVLQPNIDVYKKWDEQFKTEIEETLARQIAEVSAYRPDIIIWPESALPGSIYEDKYYQWIKDTAVQTGAYQVVGSDRFEQNDQFVSAYLMNPEGILSGVYDKVVLVPFGEYIPFEDRLSNLNLDIQTINALGSFTPGNKEQRPLFLGDKMFAANLCYESFFPALWRDEAKRGARFFVNLTNDAWYLDTSAPYNNFGANIFRAVETGRPVIRAANTGVSGWIDRFGRVQKRTSLGTAETLVFDVPLMDEDFQTVYNNWGDIFVFICLIFFVTGVSSALVFMYE